MASIVPFSPARIGSVGQDSGSHTPLSPCSALAVRTSRCDHNTASYPGGYAMARHPLVFRHLSLLACLIFTVFALCPGLAFGQATIQAGSISGTITDPSGAVVPAATVTITSTDTGQKKTLTTTSSGAYNSGPLSPGNYKVHVEKSGFSPRFTLRSLDT